MVTVLGRKKEREKALAAQQEAEEVKFFSNHDIIKTFEKNNVPRIGSEFYGTITEVMGFGTFKIYENNNYQPEQVQKVNTCLVNLESSWSKKFSVQDVLIVMRLHMGKVADSRKYKKYFDGVESALELIDSSMDSVHEYQRIGKFMIQCYHSSQDFVQTIGEMYQQLKGKKKE